MSSPQSPSCPENLAAQMVACLNDLRNALVRLSLFIQDYQFDFDTQAREAIGAQSRELLDKVRLR